MNLPGNPAQFANPSNAAIGLVAGKLPYLRRLETLGRHLRSKLATLRRRHIIGAFQAFADLIQLLLILIRVGEPTAEHNHRDPLEPRPEFGIRGC